MGRASNRTVTRREIRKAFGPEALELIANLDARVDALEEGLENERQARREAVAFCRELQAEGDRIAKEEIAMQVRGRIEAAHDEARDALGQIRAHRDRGFSSRFWWLLTGR